MKDFVGEIRKFVERECKKPTSKYGYEPYPFHFVPTVKYASRLADKLGGDKEVILIAAWLHDIGSIVKGRKDHHLTGSELAEKKLRVLGYPPEKINMVKKCILNHRGSKNRKRESLEEQIVAEADVLSNFDSIPGIFKAAFVYENKTQAEARISVRKKLENKWRQLKFDESKKIIKPKYEAVKLLFN